MDWTTSREEPQYFNIYEAGWRSSDDREVLHGVDVRLLSEDPDSGSATYMAQLPAGWRATEQAQDTTLELFVLEGDVSARGERVGTAGFVAVPRGSGPCELSSANGAYVYMIFNPTPLDRVDYDGELSVGRTWQQEWIFAPLPGSLHGRMYKPLRVPDMDDGPVHGGPNGLVHMVLHAPGFNYPHAEYHHESWEEMFIINGDNLMPGRGEYGAGTYISNPAGYCHGMYMSQGGMLMLRHTTRPIDFDPVPLPWGPDLVEHHMDRTSLMAPPLTEDWSDSPDRAFATAHPGYRGKEEYAEGGNPRR